MLTIASVHESVLDLIGNTPLVDVSMLSPNSGRPHSRQAGEPEPVRIGQGPHRQVHDRGRREARPPASRPGHRRTVVREHGDRPGGDRPAQGLSDQGVAARERLDRAPPDAQRVRRRDHPHAGRGGLQRRRAAGRAARCRASRVVLPVPVRQRRQPAGALRGHGSGDLARLPGDHPLRRRAGHERHADGHRPVPQGAQPRRQDRRHRAAPGRACRGAAQPRRRLHPAGVRRLERLRAARSQAGRAAA